MSATNHGGYWEDDAKVQARWERMKAQAAEIERQQTAQAEQIEIENRVLETSEG